MKSVMCDQTHAHKACLPTFPMIRVPWAPPLWMVVGAGGGLWGACFCSFCVLLGGVSAGPVRGAALGGLFLLILCGAGLCFCGSRACVSAGPVRGAARGGLFLLRFPPPLWGWGGVWCVWGLRGLRFASFLFIWPAFRLRCVPFALREEPPWVPWGPLRVPWGPLRVPWGPLG